MISITRSGVMNRCLPISACLPTGPPIDLGQRGADGVGAAGQVAVVEAAPVGAPARGRRTPSSRRRASVTGAEAEPAVWHPRRAGGPGAGPTRRRAERAGTVVGGPNRNRDARRHFNRRLDHRLLTAGAAIGGGGGGGGACGTPA